MRLWAEQTADRLLDSLPESGLSSIGDDRARAKALLVTALEQLAGQLSYDMAYGLSHELNNPLANIAARARLLVEQESSEARRVMLSGIVDQAMRGCEMIADLMLLARPPAMELEACSLSEIVDKLCRQAAPWIAARRLTLVAPESRSEAENPSMASTVRADSVALEEALWCVLRNAIEAASERIVITLSCDAVSNDHGWRIEIRDDGPGLSQAALERAFHPYYSGREAGRGLGLGLCKARRIIEQFGGAMELKNDSGCCASIWLPSSTAAAQSNA